jgi:hypothetical protein
MATYKSSKVTNSFPARSNDGENIAFASVSVSSAAANGDVVQMFKVPANATIVGAVLRCSDMDTSGSPTVTVDVGDAGDADRLFAASTVARAGGADVNLALAGLGYKYTEDTLIYATINSPATGATGTVALTLFYVVGQV